MSSFRSLRPGRCCSRLAICAPVCCRALLRYLRAGVLPRPAPLPAPGVLLVILLPLASAAGPVWVATRPGGRTRALEQLAALGDVRALGYLLRARCEMLPRETRMVLERALLTLLGRVTAADRGTLSASDLRLLNAHISLTWQNAPGLVSRVYAPEITFGIVRALQHVGNAASLRQLQRLSGMTPQTPQAAELVDTARASAQALRGRLAAEQAPGSLLRPVTAGKDVLLRAATTAAPTRHDEESVQLLRPDASVPPQHVAPDTSSRTSGPTVVERVAVEVAGSGAAVKNDD